MLRPFRDLKGFSLVGRDGEIGTVKDLYFNDQTWTVRHLVVDTGRWLAGRKVLLDPQSFGLIDEKSRLIVVHLIKEQIENSPPIAPCDDPHLRSTGAGGSYSIHATDGDIGSVGDFVLDDEGWRIRYLLITRSCRPEKLVAISTAWIARVRRENMQVFVPFTRNTIKDAPECDSGPIKRGYEQRLHDYYERRGYWPIEK